MLNSKGIGGSVSSGGSNSPVFVQSTHNREFIGGSTIAVTLTGIGVGNSLLVGVAWGNTTHNFRIRHWG